jgi:GGDEF domain-containing protein
VVLLPDIKTLNAAAQVAEKLLIALSAPYDIDGQSVLATPSIGISIYPDDHHEVEVLISQADRAMYDVRETKFVPNAILKMLLCA